MAERVTATLKRKSRTSRSVSSESETGSPHGKKIFTSSFHTTLCEADISEGLLDDSSDQVLKALDMSNKIGQQLQQILDRLERMEIKLQKMEGVLDQISNLEKAVNNIQADLSFYNEKVIKMDDTIKQIEVGLTGVNADIEAMERKEQQRQEKIKSLEDKILYQEVYSRRENLRFFGIPEAAQGVENTSQVLYKFFEDELELENGRDIEFQRIHRVGKKKTGQPRPIIARFLRFPEREFIFKSLRGLGEESGVKVYADFPGQIQERRKKQWPKMKKAREEGKVAYFDRQEPDKLYIEGVLSV